MLLDAISKPGNEKFNATLSNIIAKDQLENDGFLNGDGPAPKPKFTLGSGEAGAIATSAASILSSITLFGAAKRNAKINESNNASNQLAAELEEKLLKAKTENEIKLLKAQKETAITQANAQAAIQGVNGPAKEGLSTGAWIGIAVGSLALITIVVVLVKRRNK